MADAIEIYLDLSTPLGAAVKGLDDPTPFSFSSFYQGALLPLRVFPVSRTANLRLAPYYAKLPIDAMLLRVLVGPRAGTTSILAAQYTWTQQLTADADGKSGYFYGDLDLNTSAMNTAIGTAETYSTFIEFQLSRNGGTWTPVFQTTLSITATVLDPTGAVSVPTPAPTYLTADQCFAVFALWNNTLRPSNAGRTIILTSPDGTKSREIGVGNDGALIDNPA